MTATRDTVANGDLQIGTTGMGTVLATFGLSASGGAIASGVWTLAFDANTVAAAAAGTAAEARLRTSGGVARITGLTVGTSGQDINLNNLSIASGQDVTLTSATITHA